MAEKPPKTVDGFYNTAKATAPKAGPEPKAAPLRLSKAEFLAIFSPEHPPMAAIKFAWDNPDRLDVPAMRLRLQEMARELRAKPLNDAIDVMMVAVDAALEQLEHDPSGLTLEQAQALKAAAVTLRERLAIGRF